MCVPSSKCGFNLTSFFTKNASAFTKENRNWCYEKSIHFLFLQTHIFSAVCSREWLWIHVRSPSYYHYFFTKILNGPYPASFSLFLSFQYTVDSTQMFNINNFFPMTGFEPGTSCIRSDHSTNWATTTTHYFDNVISCPHVLSNK